jgi:hypothetical protein
MSVQDKLEYTKVIRNLKWKERQYYDQKKKDNKTNHFLQDVGSSPGRVKPKTMKLVFVASPLNTQH